MVRKRNKIITMPYRACEQLRIAECLRRFAKSLRGFTNTQNIRRNSPGSQKLRKEDKLFIKHYSHD